MPNFGTSYVFSTIFMRERERERERVYKKIYIVRIRIPYTDVISNENERIQKLSDKVSIMRTP